jgi:hypothetical protein
LTQAVASAGWTEVADGDVIGTDGDALVDAIGVHTRADELDAVAVARLAAERNSGHVQVEDPCQHVATGA